MELTLAERKALTKTIASRYARSDRPGRATSFVAHHGITKTYITSHLMLEATWGLDSRRRPEGRLQRRRRAPLALSSPRPDLHASHLQDLQHRRAAQPEYSRYPPTAHAGHIVFHHFSSQCLGNSSPLPCR
jgi:hypothetical protein